MVNIFFLFKFRAVQILILLHAEELMWGFLVQDDFNRMEEINDIGIEANR